MKFKKNSKGDVCMAVSLGWSDEQEVRVISPELIQKLEELLIIAADAEEVEDGEVALTFVDDETMHRLNLQYRGIDRTTDVLSFAMQESIDEELDIEFMEDEEEEVLLGDIIISVPKAIAQAEDYGHSFEREIGFLFIHGFLHLIGYDHGTEEEEKDMTERQERILTKAGLTR